MANSGWFEVDKEGLAKLLTRRGKGFVINELVQNAWDTDAKNVEIVIDPIDGRPLAKLVVADDDPEGFADLRHAFTLFAESVKKGDPEKRGRFNLGEKLVLSICEEAKIVTTKGTVSFDKDGRHESRREKLDHGSMFSAMIRIRRDELADVNTAIGMLIPPKSVQTVFNGKLIPKRTPVVEFDMALPTEIADAEGHVRKSIRSAKVSVYEVGPEERAHIYEMGIPIVATGDKWHYSVGQKVPLNVDRDNVTPAYLQDLRVEVLNHLHDHINKEDATASWVRDAAADEMALKEAVETVVTHRFGERRVIADPSDPEGTKLAMAQGYTVIPPGSMSGNEWANVKKHGVARPAGQVTPSPKPYSENGRELKLIEEKDWTPGMARMVKYIRRIAPDLIGHTVRVQIANDFGWHFAATYGGSELTINVARVGKAWFDRMLFDEQVNETLIHEFAHEYSSDHLSDRFHHALCTIGARLAKLVLKDPDVMRD